MSKKLPDHIDGLVRYLSSPDEKANEDLILKYFRKTFGDEFTRQEEADRSDGYLPGHFVLELKGKTNDWLSGLFQGIAYRKSLDFGVVIVAAKNFGSTPKTGAVELLLACVGLYSDSKIIKISHSVSSIQYLIYSSV